VARGRLHREDGASAVEMALLAPLLFILVFGIIEFGLAFLQVQSIKTGVREGGRAAAVGWSETAVQQKTIDASSGAIPDSPLSDVGVSQQCTAQNIGSDVIVSYDTTNLNEGDGIVVRIPMLPDIHLTPDIKAQFRCEV
jgi:Flp pilus assembly protein TadG